MRRVDSRQSAVDSRARWGFEDQEAIGKDSLDQGSGNREAGDLPRFLERVGLPDRSDPVLEGFTGSQPEPASNADEGERNAVAPDVHERETDPRDPRDLSQQPHVLLRREVMQQKSRDDAVR